MSIRYGTPTLGSPAEAGVVGPPSAAPAERARRLVAEHGWNALSYQVLNAGLELWFPATGEAVVGYARWRGVRVVAGAPVCAVDRLESVAAAFERAAARAGDRVCYIGAGERLAAAAGHGRGRTVVEVGALPVWRPAAWPAILARHASLRAQVHRARNKGAVVEEWPAPRAERSTELRDCLREWLASRGLPPLRFLVEPNAVRRLLDRRIFVTAVEGAPVGYLILAPVPVRGGWLVEQIVRGSRAPNGAAEAMVDAAFRAILAEGASFATLGPAPLARRDTGSPGAAMPWWLGPALSWARSGGGRFYNVEGLYTFKAKFRPEAWEPVYLVAVEPRLSLRTVRAVVGAFAGRGAAALAVAALRSAARRGIERSTARPRRVEPAPRSTGAEGSRR